MMHHMTVVLRNGASVQMPTAVPRTAPYFLRQVGTVLVAGRSACMAGIVAYDCKQAAC